MPHYAAMATGNWNTAGTWNRGTNTPTLHASTNVSLSTSASTSATFTAPSISDSCTGLMVYLTAKGTATTITATLQEATVDTAHTATITLANVNLGWIRFEPATPYLFTAVTAGRYRWKLTVDSGTTTTVAQASTANFAYISLDNRTAVPASGDNAWIVSGNNATAMTVTMDGTQTVGTANVLQAERSTSNAILINNNAQLQMDTAASSTLNIRGDVYIANGGEFSCATSGSRLSSSYIATVNATTANSGINYADGATGQWHGATKAFQTTTLVSGVGTAASPLITADAVDWTVGDRLVFAPTGDGATNYDEPEVRYIITKNSATSYVVSSTAGGAETALLYTHTGGRIGNFTNNVIIKGNDSSTGIGFNPTTPTSANKIDLSWVTYENAGNSTFFGALPTKNFYIFSNMTVANCAGWGGSVGIFMLYGVTSKTFSNLITYNDQAAGSLGTAFGNIVMSGCNGVTLTDCYSFGSSIYGLTLDNLCYSNTIEDCEVWACDNSGAAAAGIGISSSGINQFTRVGSHANRVNSIYIASGPGNKFTDCNFGVSGDSAVDVYMGTGYSTALFSDCVFESPTLIGNYTNMTLGSEIRFHRLDDTDNNHTWYTVYGAGKTEDTEVRTADSLAVRIAPQSATGFTWDFQIPAKANSIVAFFGYFMKNTAFSTDDCVIELWLPGSITADASYTLADTYDVWQAVALSVSNTQSVDGLATIKVIGKTTTASAYLYCDDFYNAGDTLVTSDKVTGLDTWFEGKPAQIITPSAVSAADIWTFDTTNLTTPNTTGKKLVDAADNSELAAVK